MHFQLAHCMTAGNCQESCITQLKCREENQGLHADVRYFQLTDVDIPGELNQRYLQALILQEDTETEKLKQEAQIIRKETEAKVDNKICRAIVFVFSNSF